MNFQHQYTLMFHSNKKRENEGIKTGFTPFRYVLIDYCCEPVSIVMLYVSHVRFLRGKIYCTYTLYSGSVKPSIGTLLRVCIVTDSTIYEKKTYLVLRDTVITRPDYVTSP